MSEPRRILFGVLFIYRKRGSGSAGQHEDCNFTTKDVAVADDLSLSLSRSCSLSFSLSSLISDIAMCHLSDETKDSVNEAMNDHLSSNRL